MAPEGPWVLGQPPPAPRVPPKGPKGRGTQGQRGHGDGGDTGTKGTRHGDKRTTPRHVWLFNAPPLPQNTKKAFPPPPHAPKKVQKRLKKEHPAPDCCRHPGARPSPGHRGRRPRGARRPQILTVAPKAPRGCAHTTELASPGPARRSATSWRPTAARARQRASKVAPSVAAQAASRVRAGAWPRAKVPMASSP